MVHYLCNIFYNKAELFDQSYSIDIVLDAYKENSLKLQARPNGDTGASKLKSLHAKNERQLLLGEIIKKTWQHTTLSEKECRLSPE